MTMPATSQYRPPNPPVSVSVAHRDQPVGEDRDPSHHLVHPSAWKWRSPKLVHKWTVR